MLDCEDSLLEERGPNFLLNCHFSRKGNVQFSVTLRAGNALSKLKRRKKCKTFLVLWLTPEYLTVFGTKLVSQHLSLLRFFSISNIIPIIGPDRPGILMKVLYIEKHCLSEKHVYQTLLVLRLLFLTSEDIISRSYYIEYIFI